MKENDVEKTFNETEYIETDVDFGFDNDGSSKYAQVYFVKPLLKDKPRFELTWKKGDKKYVTNLNKLQGKLKKVEQSSYVWNEETVETLKFHIEWMNKEKEPILFILGTSYTNVMRSLLNTLLGCTEPIEKISLNLYEKDGFANMYILINGKKGQWKYDWKTLNEKVVDITNPKTKKVIQRDYSELNEFLRDELFSMINKIVEGHMVITPEEEAEKFFDEEEKPKRKTSSKKSSKSSKSEEIFGENDTTFDDLIEEAD